MLSLKSYLAKEQDLDASLGCVAQVDLGIDAAVVLPLWRQWFASGAMRVGRVDMREGANRDPAMVVGVTVWLTPQAVAALSLPSDLPAYQRVYQACARGEQWVMSWPQIVAAHGEKQLHLMVLHFWARFAPPDDRFQALFLQSEAQFRQLHQGYGIAGLYQCVPPTHVPYLESAGFRLVHSSPTQGHCWMHMSRETIVDVPGCTLAFLFYSAAAQMNLSLGAKRMIGFALEQLTDEEIAEEMQVGHDYVRKLWKQVFEQSENIGLFKARGELDDESPKVRRGKERRRTALEYMRNNLQEIRPAGGRR